jgi:hypothetical protein
MYSASRTATEGMNAKTLRAYRIFLEGVLLDLCNALTPPGPDEYAILLPVEVRRELKELEDDPWAAARVLEHVIIDHLGFAIHERGIGTWSIADHGNEVESAVALIGLLQQVYPDELHVRLVGAPVR